MKTRTIFEAYARLYRGVDWVIPPKRLRQHATFRAELLSRMDERDELAAKKADRVARLQALYAANPGVKPWSSDRATT